MSLLFSHMRSRTYYGVIIDVGSGSVGVGIVSRQEKRLEPHVIFTHREVMRIGSKPSPKERVRAMRQALFSALLVLSNSGLTDLYKHHPRARIEKILVVCSAPWSQSVTQFVHFEGTKPFEVTREWVEELLHKAEQKVKKEFATHESTPTLGSELLSSAGIEVVEKAIIEMKLNGYTVDNPYGKHAHELALARVSGLVSYEVLDALKDIQKIGLAKTAMEVHSYALVLYCVFRDIYPYTEHALMVDISGEATEIMVLHDGVLRDTHTIHYGVYTLIRDIARAMQSIPEEAQRYVTAFTDADEATHTHVMHATSSYMDHIRKGLKRLSQTYVVPHQIYLTVDPSVESFFHYVWETLAEEYFGTQGTKERIVVLRNETAQKHVTFEKTIVHDPFIATVAHFYAKLHACNDMQQS